MELIYAKFCPFARASELLLKELNRDYAAFEDQKRLDYPTLKLQDRELHGFFSIAEYLTFNDLDPHEKRMWLEIILNQCWHEGARSIIEVRIRSLKSSIRPDTKQLHNARTRLITFFSELDKWLTERHYLSNKLSYSDILLASIASYLDYLNEIKWEDYQHLAEWYSRIKSRPSFKSVLDDIIPGLKPPSHYKLIDF
jgi:glutathione S-transferase